MGHEFLVQQAVRHGIAVAAHTGKSAFEPEFHSTMPEHARLYGVPAEWRAEGVVKYGFHGASHQFIAGRVREMMGRDPKLVSCHLGGSSSICAIADGHSIDTTMGFSDQKSVV